MGIDQLWQVFVIRKIIVLIKVCAGKEGLKSLLLFTKVYCRKTFSQYSAIKY